MIYVRSAGPVNAKIVVVGEAPGADEEMYGRPFCGPAGHELGCEMAEAKINKSEVFLTNVCRYRPPMNDIDEWIKNQKKSPDPSFVFFRGRWVKDFIVEHIHDLEKELTAIQPNVVVAVGGTPLWALTGKTGIMKWRSSLLKCILPGLEHLKVIPVYHPSYVLRDYSVRWETVEDWRRVFEEALFPEIKDPGWQFTVRPSYEQAADFLIRLLIRADKEPFEITCDIETRKRQIACVGLGLSRRMAFCIPIMCHERREGYFSHVQELEIVRLFKRIRAHPNIKIIGQNFLYDAYYFMMLWGLRFLPSFDTMVAQHVCYPGKEKNLAFIASLYCKDFYRFWKDDGKEWVVSMNEEDLWIYNCMDCCYTWEAAQELKDVLTAYNQWPQFNFLMKQHKAVLSMMARGVNADVVERENFSQVLDKRLYDNAEKVKRIVGFPLNLNSPDQIIHFFYDDLGIKPVRSRKTGANTTDDDALQIIRYREPLVMKVCDLISESRSLKICKSNFVDCEGPRDRFLTTFKIAGPNTFRYASGVNPMGWGTNLQNVVKLEEDEPNPMGLPDIRALFKADPGYTLVSVDYSKADLHVVVWEAGEEELKLALRNRVNIYKEYGTKITGMPYHAAKMFLHGTNYGGKPRTMAINTNITTREAEIAQARWFGKYAGIKQWHLRVEEELRRSRSVSNKFGFRRIFFDRIEGILPEALAWCPQSTVAIVVNTALTRIDEAWPPCPGRSDVELLLQVHDELVLQVRTEKFEELMNKLLPMFEVVVPYDDPLVIAYDCKVGLNDEPWSKLKSWKSTVAKTKASVDDWQEVFGG